MYLNICEKSLTSVFIFCFKENWEKVPFLKVLDKKTPLNKLLKKSLPGSVSIPFGDLNMQINSFSLPYTGS